VVEQIRFYLPACLSQDCGQDEIEAGARASRSKVCTATAYCWFGATFLFLFAVEPAGGLGLTPQPRELRSAQMSRSSSLLSTHGMDAHSRNFEKVFFSKKHSINIDIYICMSIYLYEHTRKSYPYDYI
jgi:hypothetical protein